MWTLHDHSVIVQERIGNDHRLSVTVRGAGEGIGQFSTFDERLVIQIQTGPHTLPLGSIAKYSRSGVRETRRSVYLGFRRGRLSVKHQYRR
jgi:hypothetical protein